MAELSKTRIDKWLWSVRIYKTRSIATDACKTGKVKVEGKNVKASFDVKVGDTVFARQGPLQRVLKITNIIERRVSSPEALKCFDDLTPAEDILALKSIFHGHFGKREQGDGRPTKKDRRDIDEFKDED
jgi:ribosome-associated heat shock protein Hsp15